jgi:hypothetical protein
MPIQCTDTLTGQADDDTREMDPKSLKVFMEKCRQESVNLQHRLELQTLKLLVEWNQVCFGGG